jgi:hypothetical protein
MDPTQFSKHICNISTFPDDKHLIYSFTDLPKLFDCICYPHLNIRVLKSPDNTTGLFLRYFTKLEPYFPIVCESVLHFSNQLCKQFINKAYILKKIKDCEGILVLSIPSKDESSCVYLGFAILSLSKQDQVGICNVLCAITDKTKLTSGEIVNISLGSFLLYHVAKLFQSFYNVDKIYLYASSLHLVQYYSKLGFHFGSPNYDLDFLLKALQIPITEENEMQVEQECYLYICEYIKSILIKEGLQYFISFTDTSFELIEKEYTKEEIKELGITDALLNDEIIQVKLKNKVLSIANSLFNRQKNEICMWMELSKPCKDEMESLTNTMQQISISNVTCLDSLEQLKNYSMKHLLQYSFSDSI